MPEKLVGVIGGSGLYNMEGMEVVEERVIQTPFGEPSDNMIIGKLDGVPVAFLSRHGRGHRLTPTEVNYRANIYAFKTLGVSQIISVTAVGSMKEQLGHGHVVIVDQFIDRTRERVSTFFGNGIVAHVPFADPTCGTLMDILHAAAVKSDATVQKGGTYVCIEGPMFSTRAESNLFRSWGVDVIGMTNYQEAKLAREAEICYATMAMITDYDCWHESEDNVDVLAVLRVMEQNVKVAQKIIKNAVVQVHQLSEECECNKVLEHSIMTDRKLIPVETKQRLEPIIGKYIK